MICVESERASEVLAYVHGWFDLSCRVAAYRTSVKVRQKVQQTRRRGPHERIDHDGRMRQEAVTERSRQHALHATGRKERSE